MIEKYFANQLQRWPLAKTNYAALKEVQTKTFIIKECTINIQFNPARIISSNANTNKQHIAARKCFLCPSNLSIEQNGEVLNSDFQILVNPFPIFPYHFTIPSLFHLEQRVLPYIDTLYEAVQHLKGYVVFYNGPQSGASAPDHVHFQAGNIDFLPYIDEYKSHIQETILVDNNSSILYYNDGFRTAFIIEATDKNSGNELFHRLYNALPQVEEQEPMLNLLSWQEDEKWIITVFPRKCHRPTCFYNEGEEKITISPASVDMGGVMIVPIEKDYNRLTPELVERILTEVSLSNSECKKIIDQLK